MKISMACEVQTHCVFLCLCAKTMKLKNKLVMAVQ